MTIIAGFSSSRQGTAPLNLAAQLSRWTGDKVVAAAIVERPWPAKEDPVEHEYLRHVTAEAARSLEKVVAQLPSDLDIPTVVHQSTSIPTGLLDLVTAHDARMVVVGSSSSGLLGRVALGSVTERLVHTAAVPVAIAPRGYPLGPADTTTHRRIRRRSRHQRPHSGGRRTDHPLAGPIADRLVHRPAGGGVQRQDRAFGRRPGRRTVGAPDDGRYCQAAQRGSQSNLGSRRGCRGR